MDNVVQVAIGKNKFRTEVQFDAHELIADEPVELGGKDLGPSPTNLLLASLGTCKAMTMRMYADQKEWPLEKIELKLSAEIIRQEAQQTTFIHCSIQLYGDLDEQQRERIYKIADRCPVQRILNNPIIVKNEYIA